MPSTFGRVRRTNAPENAKTTIPARHRCSVDATDDDAVAGPATCPASGRTVNLTRPSCTAKRSSPEGLVQVIAANLQTVMINPGSNPWFGSSAYPRGLQMTRVEATT